MKNILFSLIISLCFSSFAQVTIDSTSMPKVGDTIRYSITALDTNILNTFLKSDTDMVWNYDSLIPIRQRVESFVESSETPYSSSIKDRIGQKLGDTLTLGGFSILDVYDFYLNSKNEFITDHRATSIPTGLSFPFPSTFSVAEAYNDNDEVYKFPLEYEDRDSSTYNFTFKNIFPPAYYSTSGYRINEVDAWGELTTPFGTFDCIRVITDVVGFDSINFNNNSFGLSSHSREYKWLSNELRMPALIINGTVINDSIFIPTTVEFQDTVRNVPSVFSPIALFAADDINPEVWDTVRFSNLTVSVLPSRYKWEIKPNSFQYLNGLNETSDSLIVVFTDTGFYDVKLVATNSDGTDSLLIQNYIRVDSSTTSINEIKTELGKLVYISPNPSNKSEGFFISSPKSIQVNDVTIFDISGRIISRGFKRFEQIIQVNSPSKSGIYFIHLNSSEGVLTRRLIVK